MSKTSKVVSIILAVLLVLIVGVSVAIYLTPSAENVIKVEMDSQVGGMYLSANVASAGNYPAVEINATVKGSSVDEVVWSLKWQDASNMAKVTDYITLTQSGLKATLVCIKKFDGKMVLSCATADGYASATCTVRYAGNPTNVSLSISTAPDSTAYANSEYYDYFVGNTDLSQDDEDFTNTLGIFYEFGSKQTVYFDLKYSNIFGEITSGDFINKNVTISIVPYGTIKAQAYDTNANRFYDTDSIKTINIAQTDGEALEALTLITCSIENGKLKIVRGNMEDYNIAGYIDNIACEYRYVDGNRFFYGITVTVDGLDGRISTETIFIRPILPTSLVLDVNEVVL